MEKFNPQLLATARKKKKLTWLQAARLLGKTKVCIWKYEHGQIDIPVSVLVQLANLYGCSVNDFMDVTDDNDYPPFDAAKFKESRIAAGLSIAEAAVRVGVQEDIINKIESGNISIFPHFALKLAKIYRIDVTSLYG